MNLYAFLKPMDPDTPINIQYKHKEIYDGPRSEYNGITINGKDISLCVVKSIWFSKMYGRIMIEL